MSLDVTLAMNGVEVFSANITHNLNEMAAEAGIYQCVWRPEEIGIVTAGEIVPLLEAGVAKLATEKRRFKALDAKNGWGTWEQFLPWCATYLQACRDWPEARVKVCR